MIKAIFWDADGVIINSKRFSAQIEKDYGITREMTSSFFENEFQDCLVGKRDLKKELERYIPAWRWKGTTDDLLTYWFSTGDELNQDVLQEIKKLKSKNIPLFLLTNQEHYRTEYMRNELGFGELFDTIFSSSYVGHLKTDIAFFENVFSQLPSLKPHEALFWDDDMENIAVAKAFGIQAYYYDSFSTVQKIHEEKVYSKYKELAV